ncbi:hypothetical protein [Alicyclobacillus tolerans]|uniref:Uncharacterized protein n=1 Tax=Alicyclobacillus tolerans TaxID=90970 RepID=A0ABT9LZ42_9BACL|nr:hypothetical protein [Alicyclobacillus tengchongensis]MDP9729515.1 hypothetical protein [Alicyclobacillus tengchongensis]
MSRLRLPKRFIAVAGSTLVGILLLSDGLFRMTALADPSLTSSFSGGLAFTQYADGSHIFSNVHHLVPGDTRTGSVEIMNETNVTEQVVFTTKLWGPLFSNNGHTGTTLSSTYISKDYSGTGYQKAFEYDNFPPHMSDTAYVVGDEEATIQTQGPFSQTVQSKPFTLLEGQSLLIQYTLQWPLSAHNDYQGALGYMQVQVQAIPVGTPSNPSGPTTPNRPPQPNLPNGGNPPVTVTQPNPSGGNAPPIREPGSGNGSQGGVSSISSHPSGGHSEGQTVHVIPISSPGQSSVIGATSPVTGVPVLETLAEALSFILLGIGMLFLGSRLRKER